MIDSQKDGYGQATVNVWEWMLERAAERFRERDKDRVRDRRDCSTIQKQINSHFTVEFCCR